MALTLDSSVIDRLGGELAAETGESLEEAVAKALAERLDRERARAQRRKTVDEIFERAAKIPALNDLPTDELLGYHKDGTFGDPR
jgi:antitoxin VapB